MNVALDQNSSQENIKPNGFDAVSELLDQAVQDGVFPGAVLFVAKEGTDLYRNAVGRRSLIVSKDIAPDPMELETVFDIASLTSLLSTTTIIMRLLELNKISLEDRMARYVQGFSVFGKSDITIRDLLSHSSGLAHWLPFYEDILREHAGGRIGIMASRGARDYILNTITRSQLKYAPRSKQQYSDLGMILIGHLIELLTGSSLDRAAMQLVFQPLGLKCTSYIDLSMIKRRGIHPVTDIIAPTEECSWRKRILCGEVHDDNAWAMGGLAGHSGVFSTAEDINKFAKEMLSAYRGESEFIKSDTLRNFWHAHLPAAEETFQLGWDTPGKHNSMLDSQLSPYAVGQNGFTGCSLWIEAA